MKKQKLTCEKARNLSIEKYLGKLGYSPKKRTEKEAWFLSPLRSETEASFKVSLILNRFYDHGLGKGGDIILLVQLLNNCSVSEALGFLSQESNPNPFSFHEQQEIPCKKEESKSYRINNTKRLEHIALLDYLRNRKIPSKIAQEKCLEVHYTIKSKKYFSIGFKNDSNGYEIRNKYIKGSLGTKDITHLKNESKTVNIFEGFIDYLSFLTIYKDQEIKEDFIILNSVSLLEKALPKISKYDFINCFFDTDTSGKKAYNTVVENYKYAIDCSVLYKNVKDYNDYLIYREVKNNSLTETLHLQSSKENRERLVRGIKEVEQGETTRINVDEV